MHLCCALYLVQLFSCTFLMHFSYAPFLYSIYLCAPFHRRVRISSASQQRIYHYYALTYQISNPCFTSVHCIPAIAWTCLYGNPRPLKTCILKSALSTACILAVLGATCRLLKTLLTFLATTRQLLLCLDLKFNCN